ncbi:hypothetical protein LINGRAHAP2_LOCUS31763, partial [Linum grandiflorum]
KKKKAPPAPKKDAVDGEKCYHYKGKGHWRRNFSKYMEDLKSGVTTPKGIYVIDMLSTHFTSWVFDTACGSHITTNMQGLKRSKILAKGEMYLRVGNGARVAAISVGVYSISLRSGLVLELNNCYYVPALTKNIISESVLDSEGYSILIGNNHCSINKNGVFYANAVLMNDLYYLDLSRFVYNIIPRSKRQDLKTYLWHCRL